MAAKWFNSLDTEFKYGQYKSFLWFIALHIKNSINIEILCRVFKVYLIEFYFEP